MKKRILAIAFLFLLPSFLRLYRISELTEFLGDQGRTGIIIYEAWVTKTIPLAGPTVLSGQHLGPFFYYLMAPSFIIANFNPLGPAVFTALLGVLTVLLMFYITNKLFGFWIGFFISTLYAVSPSIVTQDRIIWEPNVIPLFILLFIISIYKIYQEQKIKYFLLLGITIGILVQLHYPNVFFIILASIFSIYVSLLYSRNHHHPRSPFGHLGGVMKKLSMSFCAGLFGFLLVLSPFLLYEAQNNFVDLKEIALILLGINAPQTSSPPFYLNMLDMSSRLFKHVIPLQQSLQFSLLQLLIIAIPFIKRNFWHAFFAFWYVVGVFAISQFKGVIFDHYLMFLLPIPFFLFGFFLIAIKKYISQKILAIPLLILIFLQLTRTDIFAPGNNDLLRTQLISNEIIKLALPAGRQSNNIFFSFTLISSRSFSDLHYRYYFKLKNVEPEKITTNNYIYLFLVCEKSPCPNQSEIENLSKVQTLCYDPHCEGEYPKINLKKFSFVQLTDVLDGRIFVYSHQHNY